MAELQVTLYFTEPGKETLEAFESGDVGLGNPDELTFVLRQGGYNIDPPSSVHVELDS